MDTGRKDAPIIFALMKLSTMCETPSYNISRSGKLVQLGMCKHKKKHYVQFERVKKSSHKAESEVVALDLEGFSILQVAIHDFEDRVRESHAQQCE